MDRGRASTGGRQGGIARPQLIAGLYLVGVLSGFAGSIIQSVRAEGLWHALGWGFGISIVDVAASAVGVHLARRTSPTPPARTDYVAAAVFAVLILLPHRAMSWAAVAGLAIYEMARNRRCPTALAAASIFILLAASVFWARVVAQVFAGGLLLSWDAWLATGLLELLTGGGVERIENVIITDHGSFVVTASCSSLRNVLYGLLCWLTVARALRPEWQRGDLLAALIVGGTVVAANTLRIALVGLSEESFEWFHGMLAENVFNLGLLLLTATVGLATSRHRATLAAR